MAIKEVEIDNFESFNKQISDILKKGYTYYRGDKVRDNDESNLLLTSFDKKKKDGSYIFNASDDNKMVDDFISLSMSKLSYQPTNYFERLLTAQHYEIPTRLQDWSESSLIALFFATSYAESLSDNDYCVFWCLNPLELNKNTYQIVSEITGKEYIPNISVSKVDESAIGIIEKFYGLQHSQDTRYEYPIAVKTYKINPRIESKKGVFLIYPRTRKSLIELPKVENFLMKIIIKKAAAIEMHNLLTQWKINNYMIFPELTSVAKDIIAEYKGDK